MLTPPQSQNSAAGSPRVTLAGQLKRRTIACLFGLTLAVLAISSLLPNNSSAVDSIEPVESARLSNTSIVSGVRSVASKREESRRPELTTEDYIALNSSLAGASLLPQPLQSGGKQVLVHFDDVASGNNVGNRYPDVVFSSPNRTIVASSTWGPPTSVPNTASPCCDLFAGFADFIATFPQPVKDLRFTVNVCDQIGTSAFVDLYQKNTATVINQKVQCNGSGLFSIPVVNFNGLSDITKVVIHNVTDPAGLAYDIGVGGTVALQPWVKIGERAVPHGSLEKVKS